MLGNFTAPSFFFFERGGGGSVIECFLLRARAILLCVRHLLRRRREREEDGVRPTINSPLVSLHILASQSQRRRRIFFFHHSLYRRATSIRNVQICNEERHRQQPKKPCPRARGASKQEEEGIRHLCTYDNNNIFPT